VGAISGSSWVSSLALAAESHPGLEAEATYSEAVIAYHQKKLKLSMEIIEGLLQQNPDYLDALELRSVHLKDLRRDAERIPVLEKILAVKPEGQRGPVLFELGLLQQKKGSVDEAKRSFEGAADLGFNVVPARLMAGMLAFNAGDMVAAERNMVEVRRRGSTEMRIAGAYYLGLVNFKRGNGALGAAYLVEARRLARKNPDLPVSRQLASPIEQVLEPFRKSQWFLNLSMLGQYDSNIQQIPTSASAQQGSSRSTPKTTLLAGFGYMGPPLAELQFVPSYRFNANKNFASGLDAYEYASNTLALSINWRALARFSAGMKAELTHSFQNFEGSYRSYTAAGDFGPFIKWTQSENLQFQLEASLRPIANFAQADLGGIGSGFRLSYRRDGATRFFNPTLAAGFDASGTRNATYRSQAWSASLSNLIRLPGDHQLTPGIDYLLTDYADAVPVRNDQTLSLRMAWAHPISAQWTALGDLAFTSNSSNIPGSYTFSRWVAGLGLSYSR